jgi:hypothetical protein
MLQSLDVREPQHHGRSKASLGPPSLRDGLAPTLDTRHRGEHDGKHEVSPTDPAAVRPPNSHQPWTPELDTQLRDTWFACSPGLDAEATTVLEIAQLMGRSRNGIRSRLTRLGCDPDLPGHALDHTSGHNTNGQDDRDHQDGVGEHVHAVPLPDAATASDSGQT